MKAQLSDTQRRSKLSIAISVAVHGLVALGLAAITFHYPIDQLFRAAPPPHVPTLRYIPLKPVVTRATVPGSTVASRRPAPRGAGQSLTLPTPASIPVGLPAASAGPVTSTVIGGGADTSSRSRSIGANSGVRPGVPDPRLLAGPGTVRVPETEGQRAERALSAIYAEYLDSARYAAAHPRREAGDWSWGGKDGDKWGWDANGIHVGGITIPNVVLAALPLNVGPTGRNMNAITERRADDYMRSDIKMHSGVMSEDEFKAAVRRIRERVDRERQEKMATTKPKEPPCCGQP